MKIIRPFFYSALILAVFYCLFLWGANSFDPAYFLPYPTSEFKAKAGDSIQWKLPEYDDQLWSNEFVWQDQRYWWRVEVDIDSSLSKSGPVGLQIRSFLGSYDAYWDGHFIGSNGKVGTRKKEEIPGGIDKLIMLPETLVQPGKHVLAVRVSQFYSTNYRTNPYLKLGNYDVQSQTLLVLAVFMHVLVGIFLIIAVYYFLLYFKSFREKSFLLFGGLSLLLFGWMVFEYLKFYYAYPYPFHFWRLDIISVLVFFLTWGTTVFFTCRFKIPYGKWLVLFQFLLQLILVQIESDYDQCTYYEVNLSIITSLGVVAWALFHQKQYAIESLFSLLPVLMTSFFFFPLYYDQTLFIAYAFFILINLYISSKKIGSMRKQLLATELRTSLLKIELLKKNIQPHYLMNTLTSLISWVGESPKVAVQFIEALAVEFETLSNVAEQKKILLKEEIELCRSHLLVMQFRNEVQYQLQTTGILETETIPPALFLTLLENGLTHNYINHKEAIFTLKFVQKNGSKKYSFFAPGKPISKEVTIKPGTGLAYIKARLRESYGDKWSFDSKAVEGGWQTIICIYN